MISTMETIHSENYGNNLECFQEHLRWNTLSNQDQIRLLEVYKKSMEIYQQVIRKGPRLKPRLVVL